MANGVLRTLSADARAFVDARAAVRPLLLDAVVHDDGDRLTHAVFPYSGIVSVLAEMEDGRCVEKTSVGNEGFLGFSYVMGGQDGIGRSVVQVAGVAAWLPLRDLDEALERFDCVRLAMLSYARVIVVQLMESAVCNKMHSAQQRVSRWLLHADDRMGGQPFLLTQEALACSLGMRRATVSIACSELMRIGAISYARGAMNILDRGKLKSQACGCYDREVAARADRR